MDVDCAADPSVSSPQVSVSSEEYGSALFYRTFL